MKVYSIFIFFTYLYLILCLNEDTTSCDNDYADNKEQCYNRSFSQKETDEGAVKCCYLEATIIGVAGGSCIPLDQKSLDDIKDYIKELKEKTGASKLKIFCNYSFYLQLSLLSLLVLLL